MAKRTFSLKMDCGNSAFDADMAGSSEVARLLRFAAEQIENGSDGGPLFDVNGNNVGAFSLDGFDDVPAENED